MAEFQKIGKWHPCDQYGQERIGWISNPNVRLVKRFAWFPVHTNDGCRVWLAHYTDVQARTGYCYCYRSRGSYLDMENASKFANSL